MSVSFSDPLSRRERQIMDVIYAQNEASVADVQQAMPDPPSYSAVRAMLGILVDKGHLKRREVQGRYLYAPVRGRASAGRSALRRVVQTFYEGSCEKAVAALIQSEDASMSSEELKRLESLIQQAKKQGR